MFIKPFSLAIAALFLITACSTPPAPPVPTPRTESDIKVTDSVPMAKTTPSTKSVQSALK